MSGRGTQAAPDRVRARRCTVCGKLFTQRGPGRNRKACYRPVCARRLKARSRLPRAMFSAIAPEELQAVSVLLSQDAPTL